MRIAPIFRNGVELGIHRFVIAQIKAGVDAPRESCGLMDDLLYLLLHTRQDKLSR